MTAGTFFTGLIDDVRIYNPAVRPWEAGDKLLCTGLAVWDVASPFFIT